ncbi:MAG: family 4 glycosyl hydrolase [Planctomycetota bacterium]
MPKKVKTVITKEEKGATSALALDQGGRPTGLKIAYIGGGSRGWAPALMKDLAICPHLAGEVRLYDIDRPQADFNAKYGNWIQTHPDAVSTWKYRSVASLKAALTGADFVFISIQPGSIQTMKVDLEEPMKYGIYQPVGDTVGPGGCIRALRTIRDYQVIAEAIKAYAPKAWCLNFTNPMTVCTRTLYEVFPGIKAYGCCHEVFGHQGFLGWMYSEMTGDSSMPRREEVDVNVLGINHFTWFDKATTRGADLLALLRAYIKRKGVIRKYTARQLGDPTQYFSSKNQVSFELFRRFGLLAAAGDRHLAEFVPWFLTSKTSCHRWGFRLTPYSYRIKRYLDAPKASRKELESGRFPKLAASGEEYVNQMLALTGRTAFRTNVNLPNAGQMGDTPMGAVVETNAYFSRDSVVPVVSGALPDPVNSLVQRHIVNQETLVRAGLARDRDLAFQAFANDPLVGRLGMDDAARLFESMMKKTGVGF